MLRGGTHTRGPTLQSKALCLSGIQRHERLTLRVGTNIRGPTLQKEGVSLSSCAEREELDVGDYEGERFASVRTSVARNL